MPIIRVELQIGRTKEVKMALAKELTEAVVDILQVSPETVRVLFQEVEKDHWFVGGKPVSAQ